MTPSHFPTGAFRRAIPHAGVWLGGAAFLALPLSVLAPLALTPLLAACAAGLVLRMLAAGARPAPFPAPMAAVLLAALAWMAASLAWTESAARAPGKLAELALIFLAGGIACAAAGRLDAAERRFFARASIAGVAVGFAFLALETASGAVVMGFLFDRLLAEPFYFTDLNRAATVAALLAWPAAAVLLAAGRRVWTAALVAALLLILPFQESAAALVAVIIGLVVLAAARLAPRAAVPGLAALSVVALLAAPFAVPTLPAPARIDQALPGLPTSGFHRLEIWRFVADRIAERPIRGWGLDASRNLPGGQAAPEARTGGGPQLEKEAVLLPLHPHNAFLQWWLELGLPGALLGAAFLALLFRAILGGTILGRGPPVADRALAAGAVATALVIANLSYGIWQSWWQAALWLTAAFVIAARPRGNCSATAP